MKLVMATRNILIHDYDDVDLGIVWETPQRDLPKLILRLDHCLAANPPPES